MEVIGIINWIITIFVFICCAHQYLYMLVPFFKKHKPHKEAKMHDYAVLISARNEENVICDLIKSIKNQTYPSNRISIFVVADNCTDNTAAAAREADAYVWERFNKEKVGKGYALDFLIKHIDEQYPDDAFDAYLVFDADNILDVHYFEEINKTFSDGHQMITSYRNSKNYGDNWITAGYGMMFMREGKYTNNSRMLLNASCAISGTGFLFSREIKNQMHGWHYHLLTEDIQFTASQVSKNRKIALCPDAVVYDEQPLTFKQSWTQRMRWAKGYYQVFTHYSGGLIKGLFKNKSYSCYDFLMTLIPSSIISVAALLMNLIALIVGLIVGADVTGVIHSLIGFAVGLYAVFFVIGAFVFATERKKMHCSTAQKIKSVFTFPLFMATYIPIGIVALFKNVEWKPIAHGQAKEKNLEDIVNGGNGKIKTMVQPQEQKYPTAIDNAYATVRNTEQDMEKYA